jgi:hypothetical protein
MNITRRNLTTGGISLLASASLNTPVVPAHCGCAAARQIAKIGISVRQNLKSNPDGSADHIQKDRRVLTRSRIGYQLLPAILS